MSKSKGATAVSAKYVTCFHQLLSKEDPKVAFLSFSTKGSAEHYRVEKVRKAVKLFGRKHKDILHANNINSNKTSNEFTYIMEVPTFTFDIYGKTVKGATDIRKMIVNPDIDNTRILNILYNREEPHPELYKMIEEKIIESQKIIS